MKKFTSVDELFEDIKKNYNLWDKIILHPSMNWLRRLIYNTTEIPGDFYRKCKRGYQRAYFGICDEDVWGLDYYLSNVILIGLKKLKKNKLGCPYIDGFDSETDEGFEAMQKEWDRILDTMIWTFETTKKIQETNWMLMPVKGWTKEEQKCMGKSMHLMTAEETKRYYEGWSNFSKYYFSLWD